MYKSTQRDLLKASCSLKAIALFSSSIALLFRDRFMDIKRSPFAFYRFIISVLSPYHFAIGFRDRNENLFILSLYEIRQSPYLDLQYSEYHSTSIETQLSHLITSLRLL